MTTPRTINAEVFHRARREGLPLNTAAYVARPAVLDLDWMSHYQFDGEWADFDRDGRRFRVTATDPRITEGECVSCRELVDAYQRGDKGIAWMTPDEYDAAEHRWLRVAVLDDDGDETDDEASLWGVCGGRNTETERLLDDRYVAEIVTELANEAAGYAETAETAAREAAETERDERDAERRRILAELAGVAVAHGAKPSDDMRNGFRRVLGWND